jgi:hypothetical protein
MMDELRRLLGEGFRVHAGSWGAPHQFQGRAPSAAALRAAVEAAPASHWCGFQLYYAMTELEVMATSGVDLIEMMMAVFDEVTPVMNLCMQVPLGDAPRTEP